MSLQILLLLLACCCCRPFALDVALDVVALVQKSLHVKALHATLETALHHIDQQRLTDREKKQATENLIDRHVERAAQSVLLESATVAKNYLGFDINNPPKAESGQELHRARNYLAQASSGANNYLGFDINNPPKAQSGQELHRARNSLAQASSGANNLLRQKQPHRRGLLMDDDENLSQEDEIGTALTEPTPECRRILNVWTSKCVFGGGGFGNK